jgi:flagellar secretion chaperone FliS
MSETSYQEQALAGATGVELVIALYDGMIRHLHRAMQCCEEDDVRGRRIAVKKAVDIVMYLQARLRPDVGGKPAVALGEFYAAMFTMMLEASHIASEEQFREVILCIRNVRDAWTVVGRDPEAGKVLPRELRTREEKYVPVDAAAMPVGGMEEIRSSPSWTA